MNIAANQLQALASQEVPPPVLLVGSNGSGKHKIAEAVARDWSGHPPMDFSHLQLVMNREASEGKMPLAELKDKLSLAPGRRQAVMINLDGAGIEVQNALLKRFEEPTSDTWLIALVQDPRWVLPTMRSRCQTIRFQLLSNEQLIDWAKENDMAPTPEQVVLARGSSEKLTWICQNPEAVSAVSRRDAAALLQGLRDSESPVLWLQQVSQLMEAFGWNSAGQAQDLLARGTKPETVLAVALLA